MHPALPPPPPRNAKVRPCVHVVQAPVKSYFCCLAWTARVLCSGSVGVSLPPSGLIVVLCLGRKVSHLSALVERGSASSELVASSDWRSTAAESKPPIRLGGISVDSCVVFVTTSRGRDSAGKRGVIAACRHLCVIGDSTRLRADGVVRHPCLVGARKATYVSRRRQRRVRESCDR